MRLLDYGPLCVARLSLAQPGQEGVVAGKARKLQNIARAGVDRAGDRQEFVASDGNAKDLAGSNVRRHLHQPLCGRLRLLDRQHCPDRGLSFVLSFQMWGDDWYTGTMVHAVPSRTVGRAGS